MFLRRVARYSLVVALCVTIYTILLETYTRINNSSGGDVYLIRNVSATASRPRTIDGNASFHTIYVNDSRQTNGQATTDNTHVFHERLATKPPVDNNVPKQRTDFMHQRAINSKQPTGNAVTANYNIPIKKRILSRLSTIFSDDYVPDTYKTLLIDNSTIHFCLIVAKAPYALEVDMFVRSVILHARRSGVFFHFIATKGAEQSLPKVFDAITHAFVNVQYEVVEVQNLTAYLNNKFQNNVRFSHPWSGIYGTGKIFMYDLLPHVNQCIVIDSDTLFGTDPAFLWSEAKLHLQPPVTLAATWSHTREHFNSGVMVHDLDRMRKIGFSRLITLKSCKVDQKKGTENFICEHDQRLLYNILKEHMELFYFLNISWNLDNCSGYRNFRFDSFYDRFSGHFFGVVHFCCFPTELKYAYERGTRYIYRTGLINYFGYLKAMNFSSLGEKEVMRANG